MGHFQILTCTVLEFRALEDLGGNQFKIASNFNFEQRLPPLPGQRRLDEVRVEVIGNSFVQNSRCASSRDPARARAPA